MSHHQGTVDWSALDAAYGLDFGACKATEDPCPVHDIKARFYDGQFKANWAKLAGIDVVRMAYHFGHPISDPDESAALFLEYVSDLQPTDLLVLDLEKGDGLTQAVVNNWAKAWAAALRSLAPSHSPVLYCGHAYMENQTGAGLNGPFSAWWYPRYPDAYANQVIWPVAFNPTLPAPTNAWGGPPDFWQFSSTFPSIEGALDADVYNGTVDDLRGINR